MRLRRVAFGWICNLRGYHRSSTPKGVRAAIVYTAKGYAGEIAGYWLRFVCLCGEEQIRHADFARGGRVPVPVSWKVAP